MNTLTAIDAGAFISVVIDGDREGPHFTINKTCKEWYSVPNNTYREWEKLCNKARLDVETAHVKLTDVVRAAGIEL